MNVGFISLGCNKNLVDTEMMIGLFEDNKYKIVNNPKEADIIVVNTCGFIESAKEEAINTILEMAEYKKERCKLLIAMGCLVQRYKKELEKAIPEVDLFLTIDEYENAWKLIKKVISDVQDSSKQSKSEYSKLEYTRRKLTTGNNMAYLKIAEGCSNRCTYCAIPYIRGPYISRKMEDILEEANKLAQNGIKEIIVIAQDTTKYGIDLYGEPKLANLLNELSKIEGIQWIRFLYSYPETITNELIDVVKNNNKICKYFDIPIQHISTKVLKVMNRKSDSESIRNTIKKIRENIPNVVIRTTVMVGFPDETEEDFNELYEFIKTTKFEKLGAFKFSKEDGTPAAKLENQIHYKTKKKRYDQIMSLQKEISNETQKNYIGKQFEAVIEGLSLDKKYYIGRTYMDAPEIDGIVYIKNARKCDIGDFISVHIVNTNDYDLIAEMD